jgi:hypothetical protein
VGRNHTEIVRAGFPIRGVQILKEGKEAKTRKEKVGKLFQKEG